MPDSSETCPKKILIVLDHPDFEGVIRLYREKVAGASLSFANGADEGLQKARSGAPDFVVVDMAAQNQAFSFCKEVREFCAPHKFKIVAVTNDVEDSTMSFARKSGTDAYVLRTQDYSIITDVIRLIL